MDLIQYIESQRDAMAAALASMVRFKSLKADAAGPGAPFGRPIADSLDYALKLGEEMGFKTRNVDGYAGHIEYGQGDEIVAVLVHLDVVPEGGQWTYPPFGGEIHDGKLYGRGTVDDKGPGVAAMFALKAVKEHGLPLKKRIRIIWGCDEESGWACMKHYLANEEMPSCGFTPDAEFPIIGSEKGMYAFKLSRTFGPPQGGGIWVKTLTSGTRHNIVPDKADAELIMLPERRPGVAETIRKYGEKNGLRIDVSEQGIDGLNVTVHGVSAHASLPDLGVNALTHMIVMLDGLELTAGASSEFVQFFAKNAGLDCHGGAMGVGLEDSVSGRLSFNLGVMELNERGAEAQIDIRYPVTAEGHKVLDPIRRRIEGSGMELTQLSYHDPLYVPDDHPLIKTLLKVYTEETGLPGKVLSIGGGTYAKAIPNTVAYGPVFPGQPELAHQRDEFISVDDLVKLARIFARAMYELAR